MIMRLQYYECFYNSKLKWEIKQLLMEITDKEVINLFQGIVSA